MPMVTKSAGCPATAPSKNGKKKKKKKKKKIKKFPKKFKKKLKPIAKEWQKIIFSNHFFFSHTNILAIIWVTIYYYTGNY